MKTSTRVWGAALLGACLPTLALADSPADKQHYNYKATFTPDPITIDGKPDEAVWQTAPEVDGWHLTRIDYGQPARDDTRVRILYDKHNLYVLFHCLDKDPSKITAYSVQNESFLHQEDNITVMLDTFQDHRNAYYFWTNPLGVRTDGRIVADGEAFTTSWAGEWESKSTIVDDGWIAEVRIPFANFQFPEKEEMTFGLMLDREQARTQEWSNWTPDGVNSAKVSRFPHLTGLKGIEGRRKWSVTPYVATDLALQTTEDRKMFRPKAGFDARLDPVPWAALKLTVNPDFSDVEADQDRLLLDTEEPLLPERRPFFVESEHLFLAPIKIFTSRRIAMKPHDQVLGGAQLTGKVGGLGFALLDVQHKDDPGDGTNIKENLNSGIIRLQQDIGKRSAINLIGVSRYGDKYGWFRTTGVDANIHIWEEIFIQAQALKSWSDVAGSKDSDAYKFAIHRFDTNSEFWIHLEDIGARYANPLGYTPVLDKQGWNTHLYLTPFPKLRFLPQVNITWDTLWRRNHEHVRTRYRQRFNLQPYLHHNFALYADYVHDDNEGFEDRVATGGFILFPNDWQSLTLTAFGGRFLGGPVRGVNGALNLKVGPRFQARLSGFYSRSEDVPENSELYGDSGTGYSWSGYAQLRYQFNPNLYTRLTLQHGKVHELADYSNVKGTLVDAVFGWHYRQWSDIFLVYSDQPFNGAQERRILSKVSFTY
ncbi:carbohydrate binding family 9 domain-containing protein [Myxococcus sp. RHSTA-1-4]|uniref:carbohydrate binding family 9 domain-containing protein n=1 Tax=Myxococcus sp. RHSTA-1-4 TaxID=2874601 RepID=UPI001CBB3D0D|nr:carbohydrate binding family 9 domain-containing protein [Myxococcus sp. RHSTA-1-4]MBZ4416514.1 carbohydrate binding family 9 domain-containing protein [Myxococcus sp. RHSTA-1-4]